ncbi:MAG: MIase-like protein [Candidatus Tectimicrobiota bacterium]|nr:MAG: MIase-like protein [Candidatus Tectomicrobia bacterium]
MLFLLHVKLRKPESMSRQAFYSLWREEAAAALKALERGAVQALYKVAGKDEVIALLEADSAAQLDRALHSMPMWRRGYGHLATEITWTPLRPYAEWAEELSRLAQA